MLILTRKLGDKIQIGQIGSSGITVTVAEIRGRHVHLDIKAPPDVSVLRKESVIHISRLKSDEEIRIVIIKTRGRQIRLGIKAPNNILVHRVEIIERSAERNRSAANSTPQIARLPGNTNVPEDKKIFFPKGILGLPPDAKHWVLLKLEGGYFHCLQSVEHPKLAILVIEPTLIVGEYPVLIDDKTAETIRTGKYEECGVLAPVQWDEDPALISANLKAPIILNTKTGRAYQVIRRDNKFPAEYPIPASHNGQHVPSKGAIL